jgi:NADH-quinone oxidoreductase subunit F
MTVHDQNQAQGRLQEILAGYEGAGRAGLLPLLLEVQREFQYISEDTAAAIGRRLRIPLADIHGVIEFYTMLYREPVGETVARVCTSPMCSMAGSRDALKAACDHLGVKAGELSSDGVLSVESVECLGLCAMAPAALIGDTPVARIDSGEPAAWLKDPEPAGIGTIGGDRRWLTKHCSISESPDLARYEARGGLRALHRALEALQPEGLIKEIKASGLVGRGGAAFPTGMKWEYTAAAVDEPRYVVCNADESEPGTFKDRVLLEGDPFAVLEGMLLAAYAVDAPKGFLFVRGEYPRSQSILSQAAEQMRAVGILGDHILGSDFSFDLEIRSGAGAYICGEETALFEAIEGKRGLPRLKPPFPTTHGLFGKPTVINNVETLCAAVWIVANGVDKYRSEGTQDSPGSKLFCLSGDVARPGVYEVAFGTRLGELIEMAGGAVGAPLAVLLGGAAGAFATPDQFDLPMTFEDLNKVGLSLGSGVVTVINDERDLKQFIVDLAEFFAHESCGKCFPCQLGTRRQLEIVGRFANGEARKGDLDALHDVGFAMTNASICGLGMTASTAILSSVEKWPELWTR